MNDITPSTTPAKPQYDSGSLTPQQIKASNEGKVQTLRLWIAAAILIPPTLVVCFLYATGKEPSNALVGFVSTGFGILVGGKFGEK